MFERFSITKILLSLMLLQIQLFLFGKGGLDCRFEKMFISGDMNGWAEVVDSLQNTTLNAADDFTLLYAEYGLTAYYIAQDDESNAKSILSKFDKHVDELLKVYPDNANYNAFKAASYGFKIGLSPWKAPFLGFYHQHRVDKALENRMNEVLPLIENANSLYFRPVIVGGDKRKALIEYQNANNLLQNKEACNWVYYSNSTWLAQVYANQNQSDKALGIYKRLLLEVPNFQYVKNELLPQLLKGEVIDIGQKFEERINID